MSEEIKKQLEVSDQEYEAIQKMIESSESPVGIDAKKTHILILKKLIQIEERLEKLEQQMNQQNPDS